MPVLLSHRQHIAIAIGLLCNTSCIAEILMGIFQRFLLGSSYLDVIRSKDIKTSSLKTSSVKMMLQAFSFISSCYCDFCQFLLVRNWDVQFRVKLLIEESRQYQSLCLMYQYFFLNVMDLWERPSWSAYSLYIILHTLPCVKFAISIWRRP